MPNSAAIYQFDSFYQQRFNHGQDFNFRFDGQITSKKLLGSSERYFIGGVNSVRVYEDSANLRNVTANLVWDIPLIKHFEDQ